MRAGTFKWPLPRFNNQGSTKLEGFVTASVVTPSNATTLVIATHDPSHGSIIFRGCFKTQDQPNK